MDSCSRDKPGFVMKQTTTTKKKTDKLRGLELVAVPFLKAHIPV